MKTQIVTCLAGLVLASSSVLGVTNTVQIGGAGTLDFQWYEGVVNTNTYPKEYSYSYDVGNAYPALSGLVLTVTAVETNDVFITNKGVYTGGSSGKDTRLDGTEAIVLKVSYSDPQNVLTGLRVKNIGTYYCGPTETIVFTVGNTSTNISDTTNGQEFDYDLTGLTPLTKETVDTWSMMVSVDDTLGVTEAALGVFEIEYVAGDDDVQPLPDPVVFDFNDGNPLDSTGVGATMLVSGLTLTTVEIVGQDGSLASVGAGHEMNSTANNALGVNSSVNIGGFDSNARDFNPGEKWIFSFDTDVNFIDIDFAGWTDNGSEMTVSWSTYTNVFYGNYDGDTLVFPENTVVPANAEISLYMTTNNPTTDLEVRVPYLTVRPLVAPDYSYEGWAVDQGLTNGINAYNDDPDNDEMDNLLEYALGANSLSNDISAFMPGYALLSDGNTNYLNYVYRRRLDRVERGLVYTVGSTENLLYDPATNVTVEVGTASIDQTFESVTNQVSADAASKQFMQLKVTID